MIDEEGGSDQWLDSLSGGIRRVRQAIAGRKYWRSFGLFFALIGPGIITSNVDNDAGGITTYSLAGAEYGLTPPVDPHPDYRGADHHPGDVRPDGRGLGQGALRPDPRTVRGADHLLPDDRPVSDQSGEHDFRICRRCGEPGDLRHQQIPFRAVQRRVCLVAGGQGELQVRGEGVSVCLRLLPLLHRLRLHGKAGLERRRLFLPETGLSSWTRVS